jgi:hypothetical protein
MSAIAILGVVAVLAGHLFDGPARPGERRVAPVAITFRTSEKGLDVLAGGALFTTLRTEGLAKPSLFPVIAPGGAQVTRGYPIEPRAGEEQDHPHHTSLWFAHGDVNGHDFWTSPKGEKIVLVGDPEHAEKEGVGTASATFEWRAGNGAVVCTERRVMTFRADEHARSIDFDFTLTPGKDAVTFGDTKEGAFAMRVCEALRLKGPSAKGSIRSSAGEKDAACWGKRAAWVEYAGPVEGRHVSVAIFDHPENPRHPTWWHARDYGLFAANPFGKHDFEQAPARSGDLTIKPGESLRLRYRVSIADRERDAGELKGIAASYGAGK